MTIVVVTNYTVISYEILTDLSKEDIAECLVHDSCLFTLQNGNQVLINPNNAVSIELKNPPLSKTKK